MRPSARALNGSAVVLSWTSPQTPQGIISRYLIFKYQPPSNSTAIRVAEVPGTKLSGTVVELDPYTEYRFTVRACNGFGCSGHSPGATARTTSAGKKALLVKAHSRNVNLNSLRLVFVRDTKLSKCLGKSKT